MKGTMDALVKARAGAGLQLRQLPIPAPGRDEVLIRIHKTAICGTDLHIYNWDAWSQAHVRPPLVIGHEYVGEIAELGAGVQGLRIGQRVSGEGHIVCGRCRNCRAGNGQWCAQPELVGVNRDGAFAEYLRLPARNAVPIPDSIPDDVVAFFDAYGNATHTALQFPVAGENVLVTGAGPIGIMAGCICKKNGARRVIITDLNEDRLALARSMGLTAAHPYALAEAVRTERMDEGFDVALEMAGSESALCQIFRSMRNGGKVALLGLFERAAQTDWNEVILKGLTLQGVYGRKLFETWHQMIAMAESGLNLLPLVTHRFPHREFERGFAAMAAKSCGKVVLDWRERA